MLLQQHRLIFFEFVILERFKHQNHKFKGDLKGAGVVTATTAHFLDL